ncbi:hypothetical protein L3Q82_022972 [Scortum barcoo]|uniref:Uncharacterized protein n=1 Tax=Scortum barcoo TaxID=214431 RepID=A0ACB8WYE2_9TELE|nr:hypothetical protein L3Q82_022972 [Scortum barcoo]
MDARSLVPVVAATPEPGGSIVIPWIQEEQCGFRPRHGTLDQLYTLHRVLEGLWEFAQPVHMFFVDLEKAFEPCPSWYSVGVLHEYGVRGLLLMAIGSLYNRSRSLVRIASNDVVLLASSNQDLQHVLGWFAAECEAAGMRISTSKSEAMVLNRKRVACPLRVGGEVLPQMEEFKYLGVLFTSEGKMEREIDRWIVAASAVMRLVYMIVVGGVPGISHREEAPGKTQDTLERLCLSGWPGNASEVPPEELGGSVWGEGNLGISAQTAASATQSRISRERWMDVLSYVHFFGKTPSANDKK